MTLEQFKATEPGEDRTAALTQMLTAIHAQKRIAWAKNNPTWLAAMTEEELDEVGRLLCHDTSSLTRLRHPIMGDLPTPQRIAQENFEAELFGYKQEPIDEETHV